ncbi:Scr1 family TA system antitoxin-like transcriptional regulator [Saccharopolyspora hattusasensis]|uniref:Scr1 family TA system antitoxin-like transcriptional regulator n=1 Tax=Saccharopolyspora hattusasensis TaxID=1128679 RepID=UPI003D98A049
MIISEHALRERIGGRAVMAGQLRKVTELADHTQLRLARSHPENHRHPWKNQAPNPSGQAQHASAEGNEFCVRWDGSRRCGPNETVQAAVSTVVSPW